MMSALGGRGGGERSGVPKSEQTKTDRGGAKDPKILLTSGVDALHGQVNGRTDGQTHRLASKRKTIAKSFGGGASGERERHVRRDRPTDRRDGVFG